LKKYSDFLTLAEKHLAAISLSNQPVELYAPITYILSLGGKRLRPVLTLIANDMFGGTEDKAIHAALAVEVFHNFSLVHDDIMDKADIRRGKPTVHKKWNETIAILSGDLMMIKAVELLCLSNHNLLPELLAVFNKTAAQVCEGQQYDMNFETQEIVTTEDYLKMIELKTAVLLGCSLKLGAICAGANKNDAEQVYEFGKNIGLAFQIQDDILDSFGDGNLVGKKIGGDITSNKKTILLIELLTHISETDSLLLHDLLHKSTVNNEAKINGMLALYNTYEVKQKAAAMKEEFLQKAFVNLASINLPGEKKMLLKQTAIDLMERIS